MESKDRVCIDNLHINTKIGIFEWEVENLQPLIFDLWIEPKKAFADVKQDISRAVNYAQLAEHMEDFVQSKRHYTLETLIDELSNSMFDKFAIEKLKISIAKPDALKSGIASVKTTRKKDD